MQEVYEAHGVRFEFPGYWELTEQQDDDQLAITVSSPDTSFWSLVLFPDCPGPEHVLESAVTAFHEEYQELDRYAAEGTVGDHEGIGCDLDFVCFELINSAVIRVCRTDRFTAMVLYQGLDIELEETRPLLEAISDSLVFDEWGGRGVAGEW